MKDSYGFIFLLNVLNYLEKLIYISKEKPFNRLKAWRQFYKCLLAWFHSLSLSLSLSLCQRHIHTHTLCLLQIILTDCVTVEVTKRCTGGLMSPVRSKGLEFYGCFILCQWGASIKQQHLFFNFFFKWRI